MTSFAVVGASKDNAHSAKTANATKRWDGGRTCPNRQTHWFPTGFPSATQPRLCAFRASAKLVLRRRLGNHGRLRFELMADPGTRIGSLNITESAHS